MAPVCETAYYLLNLVQWLMESAQFHAILTFNKPEAVCAVAVAPAICLRNQLL